MNDSETRMILAQCSAMDNRKMTDAAAIMWQGVLGTFTYGEVKWAMMHHYRNSTEYLMPAHLVQIISEKRTEYRWMNPSAILSSDSWLEFEDLQDRAAQECRDLRASGAIYAVDAMDSTTPEELE